MNDVRMLCALMARRAPVRLEDGRTGFITRVVASYPDGDIDLHVWVENDTEVEGPAPCKVRAATVCEVDAPEPRSA